MVDAGVSNKILRPGRLRMIFEVRLRTDDGEAKIGTDSRRNHILGQLLSHPNAGVVALGHDVGEAVIEHELDLDVGVFGKEFSELGPEDVVDRIVSSRNPNGL